MTLNDLGTVCQLRRAVTGLITQVIQYRKYFMLKLPISPFGGRVLKTQQLAWTPWLCHQSNSFSTVIGCSIVLPDENCGPIEMSNNHNQVPDETENKQKKWIRKNWWSHGGCVEKRHSKQTAIAYIWPAATQHFCICIWCSLWRWISPILSSLWKTQMWLRHTLTNMHPLINSTECVA